MYTVVTVEANDTALQLCYASIRTHTIFSHGLNQKMNLGVQTWAWPTFFKHTLKISGGVALWWKQWNWITTNCKNPTMNHKWTALAKQQKLTRVEKKKEAGWQDCMWVRVGKKTDVGEPWTLPLLWLWVETRTACDEYVCAVRDTERPGVQHLSRGSASTSITHKLSTTLCVAVRCTDTQMEGGCRFKRERKEVGPNGIDKIEYWIAFMVHNRHFQTLEDFIITFRLLL